MPRPGTSRNRGPAAAAENHEAILAAARRLFASEGYRVPLSAIAREAGVGQGVLYRHFPTRLALAFAVFADNYAELERLAADTPGPECLRLVWTRIVSYTLASSAFVEMVLDARSHLPHELDSPRLEHLLAAPLSAAQAAGLADPRWTPHDLLLMQHMVYGVAIAQTDRDRAVDAVRRALGLIDPRLVPSVDDLSEAAGAHAGPPLDGPLPADGDGGLDALR